MKTLSWVMPEFVDPLEVAQSLRESLRPYELEIDTQDGYSQRITQLTELVEAAGEKSWMPLEVMKANAVKYGPQYRFRFQTPPSKVKGFVNRHEICFIFENPLDSETERMIRLACRRIKGATEQFDEADS